MYASWSISCGSMPQPVADPNQPCKAMTLVGSPSDDGLRNAHTWNLAAAPSVVTRSRFPPAVVAISARIATTVGGKRST